MSSTAPARGRLLALVLAALTCLLSVAVPLAPVVVSTPEVTWPRAGQAPTSTTALFMPYRPLDVTAEVPCAAVGALAGRTAPGEQAVLVATAPTGSERGRQRSLSVSVADGRLLVRSSGRELLDLAVDDPRLATPGCVLRVVADQDGTTVTDGSAGQPLASAPGLPVPEVTAFVTDVTAGTGAGGAAPSVVAHPDARFESRPGALKVAVLVAHAVTALLAVLVLLLAAGPAPRRRRAGRGHPGERPARLDPAVPGRWRRGAALTCDAVVSAALVLWAGVGPLHTDDFYYVLEARSVELTGTVGNVVRYFSVPEIPFTLQQLLLAAVVQVSAAPWAVRLPAALCGIGTWLLLTRVVLPRLVQDPPLWTRPLAAVVLLAWWWPFNTSARPESLVVLVSTATLALVLEAVARRRVWLLGLAAATAGAAVAVTASGLLSAGLLLVLAPRWWPLLRESRLGALPTAGLLLACASVASPLVFADASLAAALTALRVHDEVGPNLAWWQEAERYAALTVGVDPNQRGYARQVVVLLTLVLLTGVTAALLRATRARGPRTSWVVPVAAALTGFGVLAVSPTKWSHHFGALAGVGTLLAVVAAVVLVRRRPTRWALLALWVVVVAVAGAAFHGPDAQVEYSAYGVDPELPALLGQPLLWAALSALVVLPVLLRRRRRPRAAVPGGASGGASAPVRDAWPELVAAAVAVVLAGSVLVQAGSVAAAAYRLRDSWSVASDALPALTGASCGFADAAVALTGQRTLDPTAAPGGAAAADAPGGTAPAADGEQTAGLLDTAPDGVGVWSGVPGAEVSTPWLSLGERSASDTLAFDVLGAPAAVTVEFAGADGEPLPVPAVPPAGEGWRRVGFGPVADAPPGAVAVRVRLRTDEAAGTGSEPVPAVTDVYRRTGQSVSEVVPAGTRVLLDWPIGLHLPCYEPPVVAGGMVEPVTWMVRSATFEVTPPLALIDGGGSYATLPEVATLTPYRGFLPGAPYREWGDLVRVEYELPTGGYDVSAGERTVPGWRWWDGAGPGPSPQSVLDGAADG
ncbi:arabinosyltransferase domain-containing protein [Kineococcus arenarius]|uniref:arabinosyltransferase domain-containing protein n=1 Tax=Kineococcus sp. SYSU DK007 TaxID=3383128 RepID=UPI003D7DA647